MNKRGRPENLKPIDNSSEEINAAKSRGRIERFRKRNLIYTARTLYEEAEILPQLIDNVKEEVEAGFNKNAIELLKVIKEPEEQKVKLDGGVDIKKVFVDKKTRKATDQHIDDFINED